MSLQIYTATPLSIGTEVDPVDTAVSNGTTGPYQLTKNTPATLYGTIQYENTQVRKIEGGFTTNSLDNTVTFSSPPPAGSQMVFQGITQLVAAAHDQDNVDGVTNPRVVEVPFWIADISEIHLYSYTGFGASLPAQYVAVRELITGLSGALVSWCELASADGTGAATTYIAADQYQMRDISGLTQTSASAAAGGTSLTVVSTASYKAGDYIHINPGQPTQEIRLITAVTDSTHLAVESLQFAHSAGENVYQNGIKMWLRVTIPLNFSNNEPLNLLNLSMFLKHFKRAR